ncbi:MAG: Small subunit (SSU) processome component [Thelocarpon superellum]|nr:MAG: Small subunit (SSU) processome component [Thelocarpon superellum]
MVRKLRHHEAKLLRKVDFTTYASDDSHRAAAVVRRYAMQKPSDYDKYNRLCGSLRQLAHRLTLLEAGDPVRRKLEEGMLDKLNMEDFVTWVDSSKIKRNILKYRDKLDDFDLL